MRFHRLRPNTAHATTGLAHIGLALGAASYGRRALANAEAADAVAALAARRLWPGRACDGGKIELLEYGRAVLRVAVLCRREAVPFGGCRG